MKVDTLFIGSGVAATALTRRLLQHSPQMSILILEAGQRVKTMDFGIWENYVVTSGNYPFPQIFDKNYPERGVPGENQLISQTQSDLYQLAGGRAFVYGGSTMIWGGWSFRRKPEDFFLKTLTGEGLDWPFDYDALEPYYCQAEDYLAVSGDSNDPTVPRSRPYPFHQYPYAAVDQQIAQGMEKLGISYGHVPIARRGVSDVPSRHAPCQVTGTCDYCPFGARYVASDYMDDLRAWNDYPNLEIRLGAVVMQIRMATKRRAAGVTYCDTATNEVFSVDADRVIVTAGTIESPKLLQRSTSSDWPDGVGNDFDVVGRYLITHPYMIYTGTAPNPLKLQVEMGFPTLVTRYFDSPEEQPKGKFVLVNAPNGAAPALGEMMVNGVRRDAIDSALNADQWPVQLNGMYEIFGRHHNRVVNSRKLNHLGMPETVVHFNSDPTAHDRLVEIGQHVRTIFQAMGGDLPDDALFPGLNSWRCDHAASTCRMSKDPKEGVVDADLRVHGTDNLYLCSNAVYPNLGAINPTVTLTALAFRLGDHLNAAG